MGLKLPRGLTVGKIQATARRNQRTLDDVGYCLSCGEPKVYGAEELVLMTAF